MAVVESGGETIVRYSRGLIGMYYALVAASGIISALCLLAALGTAIEAGRGTQLWTVGSWIAGAVSFALMAIQLYTMGRAYARTYVAVGPEGVRIHLPTSGGAPLAIGNELRFQWSEIDGITYEHKLRKRVCRFTASDYIYTLTQNNCPSPGTVAELLAEKKGVPLTAPKVSA